MTMESIATDKRSVRMDSVSLPLRLHALLDYLVTTPATRRLMNATLLLALLAIINCSVMVKTFAMALVTAQFILEILVLVTPSVAITATRM